MSNVATTLHTLHQSLRSVDVSHLDEPGLRAATAEVRNTERALAAIKIRISQRANQLASTGAGADAGATLLGEGDVSGDTARKEAARADIADDMPAMGDALTDGRLSSEHLDAIARAAKTLNTHEREALADMEADLADAAARMPVDTFKRHLRRQVDRIRNDHGLERSKKQRARSQVRYWTDNDGMGHLHATLDPERHTVVTRAIEREMAARAAAADAPVTKNASLAADALVELISHGNGRRGRPHIDLVVDADTALHGPHAHSIRQTVAGTDLPPHTIDRFACDATIRKIVIDERGVPIQVGRSARTATDGQWSALKAIHTSCAWKGCDRPVSWCQAHHLREWNSGGTTDLDNLIPLCNQHHHAVHEGRWTIHLQPDRTLAIHRPDKTHWATTAPDRLGQWLATESDHHPPPHRCRQPTNN